MSYWQRGGEFASRNRVVRHGERLVRVREQRVVVTAVSGDALGGGFSIAGKPKVTALAVSRDGALLATGHSGGLVCLWHLPSGRELRSTIAHDDHVYTLDFGPDGTRLASGGIDFSVRVWDTASLEQTIELRGHTNSLRCVRWSPDGSQLASCGSDGTVRLWDSLPPSRRAAMARAAGTWRIEPGDSSPVVTFENAR